MKFKLYCCLSLLLLIVFSGFSYAATVNLSATIEGETIIFDASGSFDEPCPSGTLALRTRGTYYDNTPPYTLHKEESVCNYPNGSNLIWAQISGCNESAYTELNIDIAINPVVTINMPRGVVSPPFDISGTVSFGMGHGLLNFFSSTDTLPYTQSTIGDGESFSYNALHPNWAPASGHFQSGDMEHEVLVRVTACNIAYTPGNYGDAVTTFIVPVPDDIGGGGGGGPNGGTSGGPSSGPPSCPLEGGTLKGKPVNISNGNVFITQHDFTIPGIMPVNFTRYYNSKETIPRGFGQYWSHSFDTRVMSLSQGIYKVITPDGSRVHYSDTDGDGIYEAALHNKGKSKLIINVDNTFVIEYLDGAEDEFNSAGYITAKVDRNGNRIILLRGSNNELTKITNPSQREINIINDTSGRITSMTLPDGKVYTYAYPYPDLLRSVTYPDLTQKQYSYYLQKLTYIQNENGKIVEKHDYDANGKAYTSSADGTNEKLTINYSNSTVTDSLTRVTTYTIDKTGGKSHVTNAFGPGCSECGQGDVSYTYDGSLNITSKTDANGNIRTKTYDAAGNVLTRTEAYGTVDQRTTTYTYSAFREVLTETDNDGIITSYTYDANGNMLTKTEAYGTADERTTAYTYYASGQMHTITDPNGNTTTNTYDQYGNLETVTNELNQTTAYAYDLIGNLVSITDANGNITNYEYDLRGRLKKETKPDTGVINYEYDNAGNRTAVIDANGNRTTSTFDDINRRIRITDHNGNTTNYTYDTESNMTSMIIKDSAGNVKTSETYTYDNHNRLTRTTHPDTTYTEQTYDPLGNILTKRDENGNITTYTYDALNRLSSVTDPNTNPGVTSYTYDSSDNLLTVMDANENVTTYTYDRLNRLKSTVSPDNHIKGTPSISGIDMLMGKQPNFNPGGAI